MSANNYRLLGADVIMLIRERHMQATGASGRIL